MKTKTKRGSKRKTTKKSSKKKQVSPGTGLRDLELLEMLIKKIIKKLEENSYEPKVQDALKAIQLKQKLVQTSRAEKIFWQAIDEIRRSELKKSNSPSSSKRVEPENRPESLEAQILRTIIGLKSQVKRGMLPVKTITDSFNQGFTLKGKSEQNQLTYHRIGRILSAMGFTKARTNSGAVAIFWDEKLLEQMTEKYHQEK
jgi:hypothetical protein